MTLKEMRGYLEGIYPIREEGEFTNTEQLLLENGAVVIIYSNGSYNVLGRNSVEVQKHIKECLRKETLVKKKVFIVYGHNDKIRTELENTLRRWGLEPVILDKLASEGKTIIEKLENEMTKIEYGIVLATADDEGFRKDVPKEKRYRCRQNVVLELGMLLAKLGRDKVAILLQHPKETERPSDIEGLLYIPFENTLEPEASKLLAREIEGKLNITIPASKL